MYCFGESNIKGEFYTQEDDESENTDNKTTEFDVE